MASPSAAASSSPLAPIYVAPGTLLSIIEAKLGLDKRAPRFTDLAA
jgi:hypothetical protein